MPSLAQNAAKSLYAVVFAAVLVISLAPQASAKSWMGVQVGAVPAELAEANGLPPGLGVYVLDVQPDSPAALAGMEPGDIVVEIDGILQMGPRHLQMIVANGAASQTLWVGLFRGEEIMSGPVTLADAPSPAPQQADASVSSVADLPEEQRWY